MEGPIIGGTIYFEGDTSSRLLSDKKPSGLQFDYLTKADLICKGSRLLIDPSYAKPFEVNVPIDTKVYEMKLN